MSPTIPVVAGIMADLVGLARRYKVRYTPERIADAIFTSSTLLPDFPTVQQGHGRVNAAAAWQQLQAMDRADDPRNPELTSFEVERTFDGHRVRVHGFAAESPVGGHLEETLWVTRHGGYPGPRLFSLRLKGDSGFHILETRVDLPRDRPVPIHFRVQRTSGIYLGFIQLVDQHVGGPLCEIPLRLYVPEVAEAVAPGTEAYTFTIDPRHLQLRRIPTASAAQGTRVSLEVPYTGFERIGEDGFYDQNRFRNRCDVVPVPTSEIDAAHHIGPLQHCEFLRSVEQNHENWSVQVGNRGLPEYETEYSDPAPDIPITAKLTVRNYAVAFSRDGQNVRVFNRLADVEGKVELYDAKLASSEQHATADVRRTLPSGVSQWRVAVSSSPSGIAAEAFLVDCTDQDKCLVAAQRLVGKDGTTLVVDEPRAGDWRIVIRTFEPAPHAATYRLREALLVPVATSVQMADKQFSSGETWSIPLPAKRSDAQYAAFRIRGTLGNEREKEGLRIAMTPLADSLP